MKIYKNPLVSRKSYFIPTGPKRTGKCEASATNGYIVEEWNGKWEIKRGAYYNFSLKKEMPIVGKIAKSVLQNAIIQLILSEVSEE